MGIDSLVYIEQLPSPEDYLRFRKFFGWSDLSIESANAGLKASLYCVCAKIGDRLIGCARIVGDGGVYFYLQDVMVDPEFQGQGIGRALTKKCIDYVNSVALSGSFVGLMAAKDKATFYEPFGFQKRDEDKPGMGFYVKKKT